MARINTKKLYKDIFVQIKHLFYEFLEVLDSLSKVSLYNAGIYTGNVHF